jgi:hypothetical protein
MSKQLNLAHWLAVKCLREGKTKTKRKLKYMYRKAVGLWW